MIKVIIVEDDPMVKMITEKFVSSTGEFTVEASFGDGEEAYKYISQGNGELLILDMYLPGMDGLTLLKNLRENEVWIETIFVTAASNLEEIEKASQLGALDYLIKPFSFARLRSSFKKYLDKKETTYGKECLTQEDVDKIFLTDKKNVATSKGIHESTLNKIMNILEEDRSKEWSTKEVAQKMDSSVVTVKKYLDYLTETGKVESTLHYKSVGRPQYRYKITI
ncbi:response regulator [Ilyobacter sp.]|uniref:response regulator n=1 Tax=Ilyobacter sp. TaxID=3100343 RepID=UPI003561660A